MKNRNPIYMGNTQSYSINDIGRGKSSSTYITHVKNNGTSLFYI